MLTKTQIFLFFVCLVVFISCEWEQEEQDVEFSDCHVYEITWYDKDAKLKEGKFVQIEYNSSGYITSILYDSAHGSREVKFTYEGNQIKLVSESYGIFRGKNYEISYESNQISKLRITSPPKEYLNQTRDNILEYRFFYESERLAYIGEYSPWFDVFFKDTLVLDFTYEYSYTGDNITSCVTRLPGYGLIEVVSYIYDSNPNFMKKDIAWWWVDLWGKADFSTIFSENNPVGVTSIYALTSPFQTETRKYYYEYGPAGFPSMFSCEVTGYSTYQYSMNFHSQCW